MFRKTSMRDLATQPRGVEYGSNGLLGREHQSKKSSVKAVLDEPCLVSLSSELPSKQLNTYKATVGLCLMNCQQRTPQGAPD